MRLQAFPPVFAVYSVFPVVFCSVEVHLGTSGLFLPKWHGLRYVLLRLQGQGCRIHLYRRFQAALVIVLFNVYNIMVRWVVRYV